MLVFYLKLENTEHLVKYVYPYEVINLQKYIHWVKEANVRYNGNILVYEKLKLGLKPALPWEEKSAW